SAVVAPLAEPVPLAELHRRLSPGTDLALDPQHDDVLGPRDARRPLLEHSGGVRALADPLAGPQHRFRDGADRADAAAGRLSRAAVRDVGEAASRRRPGAADHPELVRRRLLDLSAAP